MGEKSQAVTEDLATHQASNQPDLIPVFPLERSEPETENTVLIVEAEVVQNDTPENVPSLPQIVPPKDDILVTDFVSPSLKALEVSATIQDFWEFNHNLTPAVSEKFHPEVKLPPPQVATPTPSFSEVVEPETSKSPFFVPLEIGSSTPTFQENLDDFHSAYVPVANRDRASLQAEYNSFSQEDTEDFSNVPSFLDSFRVLEIKPTIQDLWESHRDFLSAAPENFNPALTLPPPEPPKPVEPEIPKEPFSFPLEIESLTTNFRRDSDNFDQLNQFIEPTAYFRLPNGDRLSLQTGYNIFQQENIEDISNVPLRIGWQREINRTTVNTVVGLDWFNRLSTTPYLYGKAETPIFLEVSPTGELESLLAISGEVEYSPYKFNARTLDNEIMTLRFGPNIFWQIDSQTSFFTTARYGSYSDGNQELLSFSRLERKVGSFFIAANLFTWNYEDDLEQESGYFSPPDFLVYTGEIGWQEELTDFLRCRVATTLGQQRLNGEWDLANSYQALCTTQISRSIALDLGYTFSNVQNRETEESVYNNHSIQGQLRIRF